MKFYQVGGCVRDRMLGLEPNDHDWVVTGATPKQMLNVGYKEVGAEFPVFLHPDTGEEYALARKEVKNGKGYKGFKYEFDPDVTLLEDLKRRDLTINAMAISEDGEIIDPYNGMYDLAQKRIRHVSNAFCEDPLRVLRAARFAARFGFYIDRDTLELMEKLVIQQELNYLTPERVWKEIEKALMTDHPRMFFDYLQKCGALRIILPELDKLCKVPQKKEYHPEGDVWEHTMLVLKAAVELTKDPVIRWASLLHDIGKSVIPMEEWPSHHGHEQRGEEIVKEISKRLKVPNKYADLSRMSTRFHMKRLTDMSPKGIVKMLKETDAFRKSDRFRDFLTVLEADHNGHGHDEPKPYPEKELWPKILDKALNISNKEVIGEETRGHVIPQLIHNARLRAVKEVINDN